MSSGLNHLEVEALTTYDSEENMLGDYDMTVPHSGLERSMTSDECEGQTHRQREGECVCVCERGCVCMCVCV